MCCDLCKGLVILGNGNVELRAVCCVVFLDGIVVVFDRHFCNVCFALEDLCSHSTGGFAELIVADGKGCDAAARADACFTCNDGSAGGKHDVVDGFGAGGSSVVGRDVKCIASCCSSLGNLRNVGRSGECEIFDGQTFVFEVFSDNLDLIFGVGFCRAIQQTDGFCIGLILSNGIVAFSGALLAQYSGKADINDGRGAIVIGLAAVIIGDALVSRFKPNFIIRLLGVVLGGVVYYIVYQVVIFLGLDTDLLKMLSAVVVAIFLAVPYLKKKYFTHPMKKHKEAA